MLLAALVTAALLWAPTTACKGCVSLDEYSFTKVVPRFKAALVKFDTAYPYGEKHETYVKFAEEQSRNPELLVAEVGIKDYGEKENLAFAESLGVDGKHLPALRFFPGDPKKGVAYDAEDFTVDDLRRFVADNSDLYLPMPGCVEEFDRLAQGFVDVGDKKDAVKRATALLDGFDGEKRKSGEYYVKIMERVAEQGGGFLDVERARLDKMLKEAKIGEKKKAELSLRLNVLRSFRKADKKDEL